MKIAIDVLALLSPESKNRGIGIYTLNMLKHLFKTDKNNQYILVNFYEKIDLKELLNYDENVTELYVEIAAKSSLKYDPNFKKIFGQVISNIINDNNIDYYYFTSSFDSYIEYDYNWFYPAKLIGTIYDLIPMVLDKIYLKDKNARIFYYNRLEFIKKFDHFYAISDSVKDDLVKYLKIPNDQITTIFSGIDSIYRKIKYNPNDLHKLNEKYGIHQNYVMMTGGDDERKNIYNLIKSFALLPTHLKYQNQLVIVCKISKYSQDRYMQLAESLGIFEQVVFTNFVPYDDLVMLYNYAYMMAFPSLYEGFGLPIVEAMACETLVLTSNNSSLIEIAKESAIIVDPMSAKSIAKGMIDGFNLSKNERKDYILKGKQVVNNYTWDRTSTILHNSLNRLKSLAPRLVIKNRKIKIAWFSPLPPIESGISAYSVDIINEMAKYADVDVYIEKYNHQANLRNGIKVLFHEQYHQNSSKYEATVFHIGNNMYHAYMIPYLKKYSGIVVLHDINLSGLALNMYYAKGKIDEFIDALSYDHDKHLVKVYVNDLVNGKCGLMEDLYSCHGFVTHFAKQILVHSEYAQEKILSKDIGKIVNYIPIYGNIIDGFTREEVKKSFNLSVDSFVISILGYGQHAKRILPSIKAFIKFKQFKPKSKLFIVGKIAPDLKKSIDELLKNEKHASDIVITGFVSEEVLDKHIIASDVCINLRFPYYGESSASLMRIFGVGRATLVTDIGSFSEIHNNVVRKIQIPNSNDESREIDTIFVELKLLAEDYKLRYRYENESKKFIESRSVSIVTKKYLDLITKEILNIEDYDIITEKIIHAIVGRDIADRQTLYGLSQTLAYAKYKNSKDFFISYDDAIEEVSSYEIMSEIKKNVSEEFKQ